LLIPAIGNTKNSLIWTNKPYYFETVKNNLTTTEFYIMKTNNVVNHNTNPSSPSLLPKTWDALIKDRKNISGYTISHLKTVSMKTSQIHNRNKFARILKGGLAGNGVAGFVLNVVENNRTIPIGLVLNLKSKFHSKDKFDLIIRNIGTKGYHKLVHSELSTGDIVKLLPEDVKIDICSIKKVAEKKAVASKPKAKSRSRKSTAEKVVSLNDSQSDNETESQQVNAE
jgi:hypothetical protein